MTTAPFIPENAPFSSEQRAWLNGFLAGLYSGAPQAESGPVAASLRFGLYFASQTGMAERLAKKMAKELKAKGHTGRNWLFFGERSASTDFLYRDELETMTGDGHLTRLDTAFSRDQEHKIYVQDRMVEQGAELWRWLAEGAQVYVCGDASRMAKDVDAALHTVVEKHGGMDGEAAKDYVAQLHDDRRYHRDVYQRFGIELL